MITIYTTAPSDYDYGFVREIDARAATDKSGRKIWRRVEMPADRADHQCGRYASGLHGAIDPAEFAKLIDYGLALPYGGQR